MRRLVAGLVRTAGLAALGGLAALPGCASEDTVKSAPVSASSFRSVEGTPTAAAASTEVAKPALTSTLPPRADGNRPAQPPGTRPPLPPITDAVAVPGSPPMDSLPNARPVGRPVVVDSVVGQINGKPVFASEMMDRLGARLNRIAVEAKSQDQFLAGATKLIGQDLQEQISSELFLAEARASLSPEQRRGLLQLVTNIQASIAAMNQGAALQADERLLAEEGKSLEDLAKEERDKMLIRVLVNRHIVPRVNVSWRDVEKAYDRAYDQYNPPANATLRLVRVPTTAAARVQKVTEELAAGRSFEDIARDRSLNDFNAGEGGQMVTEVKGPMAEATLLPDPVLNEAARSLTEGQVSAPVKSGTWTSWVKLEKIERAPGVPLRDAQLEIYKAIHDARFRQEYLRFVRKLEEAGSRTDIVEMATRLVEIAAARYYTPLDRRPSTPGPTTGGSGRPGGS